MTDKELIKKIFKQKLCIMNKSSERIDLYNRYVHFNIMKKINKNLSVSVITGSGVLYYSVVDREDIILHTYYSDILGLLKNKESLNLNFYKYLTFSFKEISLLIKIYNSNLNNKNSLESIKFIINKGINRTIRILENKKENE